MISLAKNKNLEEISLLMYDIFSSKMQNTYSQDGINSFKNDISLTSLQTRFSSNSQFYIYTKDSKIIAVLELEKPAHIAFLFSKIEGIGVAKKLCSFAQDNTSQEFITVGSYCNAIGFYKKLGFIEIDEEKTINGIAFTFMAKSL